MFSDRRAERAGTIRRCGSTRPIWWPTIASELTDLFAFGLNAKYVMVSRALPTQGGSPKRMVRVSLLIGRMFKVGKLVRLGVVLKDYGLAKIKLDGADYEWPTKLVLGGAVRIPMFGTLVAADLETPLQGDQDPAFHLGVEQPLLGILALRVGGYQETDGINFTAGCGLKLGPVALDVAANLDAAEATAIYVTAQLKF